MDKKLPDFHAQKRHFPSDTNLFSFRSRKNCLKCCFFNYNCYLYLFLLILIVFIQFNAHTHKVYILLIVIYFILSITLLYLRFSVYLSLYLYFIYYYFRYRYRFQYRFMSSISEPMFLKFCLILGVVYFNIITTLIKLLLVNELLYQYNYSCIIILWLH